MNEKILFCRSFGEGETKMKIVLDKNFYTQYLENIFFQRNRKREKVKQIKKIDQ